MGDTRITVTLRELDALVQEHVFGHPHDYVTCRWCQADFRGERYQRGNPHIATYSSTIADAWAVWVRLPDGATLTKSHEASDGEAVVALPWECGRQIVARHRDEKVAICLAALATKGIEVEIEEEKP